MHTPFISVHQIVKENTNLGVKFLDGCLTSLSNSMYPDELIIVDNGSFEPIFDLYESYRLKFLDFNCTMKIIKSKAKDFATLRNQCLEFTNEFSDYIHWIDSDEIYYEEDLDTLKHHELPSMLDYKEVWTSFYHFMRDPFMIQVNNDCLFKNKEMVETDIRIAKDNVFRYNKNMKWVKEKQVHERVDRSTLIGIPDTHADSMCRYLHLGYIRNQYITTLKWLRYDIIQHGNVNGYRDERVTFNKEGIEVGNEFEGQEGYETKTVDYFRKWRDPNNIIFDRIPHCIPYPKNRFSIKDYLPTGMINLIGDCKNADDWITFIGSIDKHEFWYRWQEKFKEMGSWKLTLDWVVEEMDKTGWDIAC